MGFLSFLLGKSETQPAKNPARETLFGDLPLEQWPPDARSSDKFPWSTFVSARSHLTAGRQADAVECWQGLLKHPGLETRHYLQAWHLLRERGHQPPPDVGKQVLGFVVEVTMPQGLDLLAAYSDHSARYYNYSGAGVVWEHPDGSLDAIIDGLLVASNVVVTQIGPWEQERPPAPPRNQVRLSFLTPSGLHFGQGLVNDLSRDPMAGRILQLATGLRTALIAKTKTA